MLSRARRFDQHRLERIEPGLPEYTEFLEPVGRSSQRRRPNAHPVLASFRAFQSLHAKRARSHQAGTALMTQYDFYNYRRDESGPEREGASVSYKAETGEIYHTYFHLRARHRSTQHHVQLSRPDAEGSRRGAPA